INMNAEIQPIAPYPGWNALISRITNRIRQSLQLDQILHATVEEVRSFLGTDRVKVCRFDSEGHGKVIAESIREGSLPSLLGLSFPAGDIPVQARQLLQSSQVRVIVDIQTQTRTISQPESWTLPGKVQPLPDYELPQRPVDPCHIHYLKCMGVASSLVVPLMYHQHLWGLLVSHHAEPRAYSNQELQVVQLVADQVSIAIAQAELLEQTQQKAQQERLINQIAALLHSPLHPSSTLTTVLQQLTVGLEGIGARLQLFTADGSTLHSHGLQPAAGYEDWLQEQQQTLLPVQRDQVGLVQVWTLSNLKPWPHLFESSWQAPIRSLILLQLGWNGQQLGWLSVFRGAVYVETQWAGYRCWQGLAEQDSRQQLPQISFQAWRELKIHESPLWSPADVELLSRVGIHLTMSIAQNQLCQQVQTLNIHLEKQVQERTAALQRSLEMKALLKRVTDQVRDSLDEARILRAVVQELALGLPIECCDICLYDPVLEEATICYEYTTTLPAAGGLTLAMTDYPDFYQQLQQGQMSQFCDLPGKGLIPSRQGLVVLVCPLQDNQGVLGDLRLMKGVPGAAERGCEHSFDELEMQLVQQVASHCAIAIRQARLYQASQDQVKELERLNQLKDNFLSTVSHELRTPLASMKMAIHLLKNTSDPQKYCHYLKILERECERETELVNDLLDLQRLEAGAKVFILEEVSLADWLPSLLYPFVERAQLAQQDLQWQLDPHLGKVVTDQASLARVVQELVNNACKYSPPNCCIQVKAQRLSPSQVQIQVINEGIEIPPQEQERIFEKFYRIPSGDPWKRGGTGLGLALVKQLMEQLKGSIRVDSGHGKTCFTVVLPQGSLPTPIST
ncbi:MAG: sensor histidine kinase, partial [Cyanobacteriota bacterium]